MLAAAVAGFFYPAADSAFAAAGLIINEIAWMGGPSSANHEWIELYNGTGAEIDLAGWVLKSSDGAPEIALAGKVGAGGYFLLERTSDESAPGVADLVYAGALSNDGETLELFDPQGGVVDRVEAGGGWPAGDNASKATMERQSDLGWQTSAQAGGTPRIENSTGRQDEDTEPACGNGKIEAEEACDDGNAVSGDGCSESCRQEDGSGQTSGGLQNSGSNDSIQYYSVGSVAINEFVPDPAEGGSEWIELYNTTGGDISLAGWTITEGSGAKTALTGIIKAFGEDKFYVVEKPKGSLNNKGDMIILKDPRGNMIDMVAYGGWDDGSMGNNAPTAADPDSVARIQDGRRTGSDSSDFKATRSPTKKAGNKISAANPQATEEVDEDGEPDSSRAAAADKLMITEVCPDPEGSDIEGEFIELYNAGETDLTLLGWSIGDASSARHVFSEDEPHIVYAKSYLVITRKASGLALNNDKDKVVLYAPGGSEPVLETAYEGSSQGRSYAFDVAGGRWAWTPILTPGFINKFEPSDREEVGKLYIRYEGTLKTASPLRFSAEGYACDRGEAAAYGWDFGDKFLNSLPDPEHTYLQAGEYAVKLALKCGDKTLSAEKKLKIAGSAAIKPSGAATAATTGKTAGDKTVVITELLPNPEGSDAEEEWIELWNNGAGAVNLLGWILDDGEGGSRPYKFADDHYLAPGGYYLLSREDSGIALNNAKDRVRLTAAGGELIDEVGYERAMLGRSYARSKGGSWTWSDRLTPGSTNIVLTSTSPPASANNAKRTTTAKRAAQGSPAARVAGSSFVPLEALAGEPAGARVTTRGVVAVLPGVLGSQYFYLTGSPGAQIYNYNKLFPGLALGDYVEVSGEISHPPEGVRLKTVSIGDIRLIEKRSEPVPEKAACSEIDENDCGRLVEVRGKVLERKSNVIFLDDGIDETVVYVKRTTGIPLDLFKEGLDIAVSGIVGKDRSGAPRLMPRFPADIRIIAPAEAAGSAASEGFSSGGTSTIELAQRQGGNRPRVIAYALTAVILAGAAAAYWKRRN